MNPEDERKTISTAQVAVLAERVDKTNIDVAEIKGLIQGLVQTMAANNTHTGIAQEQMANVRIAVQAVNDKLDQGSARFEAIDKKISQYDTVWKIIGGSTIFVAAVVGWGFSRLEGLSSADQDIRVGFTQQINSLDRRTSILEFRIDGIQTPKTLKEQK